LTIRTDDTRATTRLYLITPPAFDPDRFARELEEALDMLNRIIKIHQGKA